MVLLSLYHPQVQSQERDDPLLSDGAMQRAKAAAGSSKRKTRASKAAEEEEAAKLMPPPPTPPRLHPEVAKAKEVIKKDMRQKQNLEEQAQAILSAGLSQEGLDPKVVFVSSITIVILKP